MVITNRLSIGTYEIISTRELHQVKHQHLHICKVYVEGVNVGQYLNSYRIIGMYMELIPLKKGMRNACSF